MRSGLEGANQDRCRRPSTAAQHMPSARQLGQDGHALVARERGPIPHLVCRPMASDADAGSRMDDADLFARTIRLVSFPGRVGQAALSNSDNRSSAPCKMMDAAILSTTSRRRLLEMSAAMSDLSASTVESRSSQRPTGAFETDARFDANARADWQLGPSEPSMLRGSPTIYPPASRPSAISRMLAASFLN